MATFDFFQDVKVTIWARQKFSIEAESYEEALQKVERFKTEDAASDVNNDIDLDWLYDTWEPLDPKDNGNQATIELYDHGNSECKIKSDNSRYPLLGTNADIKH